MLPSMQPHRPRIDNPTSQPKKPLQTATTPFSSPSSPSCYNPSIRHPVFFTSRLVPTPSSSLQQGSHLSNIPARNPAIWNPAAEGYVYVNPSAAAAGNGAGSKL